MLKDKIKNKFQENDKKIAIKRIRTKLDTKIKLVGNFSSWFFRVFLLCDNLDFIIWVTSFED